MDNYVYKSFKAKRDALGDRRGTMHRLYYALDYAIEEYAALGIDPGKLDVLLSREIIKALSEDDQLMDVVTVDGEGGQTVFGLPFTNADMKHSVVVYPRFGGLAV